MSNVKTYQLESEQARWKGMDYSQCPSDCTCVNCSTRRFCIDCGKHLLYDKIDRCDECWNEFMKE